MKTVLRTLFVAIGLIGLMATSVAAQDTQVSRIIIVDFQRVTTESLVGVDVASQLESSRVSIENRAAALDAELVAEQQRVAAQRGMIADEAYAEMVRGFNERRAAAEQELRNLNQLQQRAAQQASLEIQRVLRPLILELMAAKGATIVLDKAVIYHAVGGLDMTTEVIDSLNTAMASYNVQLPEIQGASQ